MANKDDAKDTSWAGTDHRYADLREADLHGKVLFQCDLRGAALYGLVISVNCDTFDGVKLDDHQMATLLRVIGMAETTSPAWRNGIAALVTSIIGPEASAVLTRYLQIHA